jgi:prepilin-type processing-associated H-X9-DG protein
LPCGIQLKNASGDSPIDNRGVWAGPIYPYVKSKQIFRCPSETGTYNMSYAFNGALTRTQSNGAPPRFTHLSALNAVTKTVLLFEVTTISISTSNLDMEDEGFESRGGWAGTTYVSYSPMGAGVGKTSNAGLGGGRIPNGGSIGDHGQMATGDMGGRNYKFGTPARPPYGRHLEGSNFLAVDGHVKWLRAEKVSSGVAASVSTNAQGATDTTSVPGSGAGNGSAAGTDSMKDYNGNDVAMTFSPV